MKEVTAREFDDALADIQERIEWFMGEAVARSEQRALDNIIAELGFVRMRLSNSQGLTQGDRSVTPATETAICWDCPHRDDEHAVALFRSDTSFVIECWRCDCEIEAKRRTEPR